MCRASNTFIFDDKLREERLARALAIHVKSEKPWRGRPGKVAQTGSKAKGKL